MSKGSCGGHVTHFGIWDPLYILRTVEDKKNFKFGMEIDDNTY